MAQGHNDYLQLLAEGCAVVVVAAIAAALPINAIRRTLDAARAEARGYWIRAGAVVGLMTIALQDVVEFSLQIPANAFLFCHACSDRADTRPRTATDRLVIAC